MSYHSTISAIIEARKEYVQEKGHPPGYIDVTVTMEEDLCCASFTDIGILVSNLVLNGPRSAYKSLFGMSVTWDAKEFRVHGDENLTSPTEEVKLDL